MVLTRCRIVRSCASEYGIGSRLLIALSSVLRVRVRSSCSNVSGNRMAGQPVLRRRFEPMDRLTLYGSFTSSSSYKPMLYLAGLPFSFRTINLKTGVQKSPEYLAVNRWGVVPSLRHRGLTILQSNVILDYLARETGHFEGRIEQERWQAREWLSWRPTTSSMSPRSAIRRGFAPLTLRRSLRFARAPRQRCLL